MIPIEPFDAAFACRDGAGRTSWHLCRAVGLIGDQHDLKLMVLVDVDGVVTAMTVAEVRRADRGVQ